MRAEPEPIRILGIDPGSITTGFGLIELSAGNLRLIATGAIRGGSDACLADRLFRIFSGIDRVIAEGSPAEVAVESLFHAKNARSALLLGHARGVVLLAASRRGLPVFEYAPQEVKKAVVGTGRAEKHQVERMVRLLLALPGEVEPYDAADGIAIAVCHAHSRRLKALAGAPADPRRPAVAAS